MAKIKTRRYYLYYLLRVAGFLVGLLPIRLATSLGSFFGGIGFHILGKQRTITLDNLKDAFPEKSETEIRAIGKKIYSNIAGNFTELAHIYKLNKGNIDLWVTPHGLHKLDEAFLKGKGVIVLTAHFGNWELVGAYMRMKGYEGATIVRKLYFYKYDRYLKSIRAIHDVGIIDRDDSPKKMLKLLKDNKVLGMLADQDIESIDGVFVDFFGKPAYTPVAPVKIAMVSGAPIIPCYMIRNQDNRYEYFVDEPIYALPGQNKEDAIKFYTQLWTRVLESYIIKYPDQWVWMHRRWKTKPEKEITKIQETITLPDGRQANNTQ